MLMPIARLNRSDNEHNSLLSGFQGEQPVILKLSTDILGLNREALALKAFAEASSVKVITVADGMLLLEKAIPGDSLKSFFPEQDHAAISIACRMINRLHQSVLPETGVFPEIKDWLSALDKEWDIPGHYLEKARKLRDHLLATANAPVLLHGDLHHENVLKNGSDWLVIDPKGVIGEPAYEVAAFIRNPMPELLSLEDTACVINNRISIFAKLFELSPNRIHEWCFVQAVLCWIWALEDGNDVVYFKHLTELFHKLS
jgi:streptomycin 6-kinase